MVLKSLVRSSKGYSFPKSYGQTWKPAPESTINAEEDEMFAIIFSNCVEEYRIMQTNGDFSESVGRTVPLKFPVVNGSLEERTAKAPAFDVAGGEVFC